MSLSQLSIIFGKRRSSAGTDVPLSNIVTVMTNHFQVKYKKSEVNFLKLSLNSIWLRVTMKYVSNNSYMKK